MLKLSKKKIFFSVEEQHDGKETNSVLYIPVGPDCPLNMQNFEKGHFFIQESKIFFFVFHGG